MPHGHAARDREKDSRRLGLRSIRRADFLERLDKDGIEPVANTPEQFAAQIKADIAKMGKIVRPRVPSSTKLHTPPLRRQPLLDEEGTLRPARISLPEGRRETRLICPSSYEEGWREAPGGQPRRNN